MLQQVGQELCWIFCRHCEPERTTADELGAYNLAAVPVGRDAYFAVSAAGFPTDAFSFSVPDDAEDESYGFRESPVGRQVA